VPRFRVTGVAADDVLNLRSGPVPESPLVDTIPPNARDLLATGRREQIGRSIWREIQFRGQTGWVNERFLAEEAPSAAPALPAQPDRSGQPPVFGEDLRCLGQNPLWDLTISRNGDVACAQTCAPGLRASPARLENNRAFWYMEVNQPGGAPHLQVWLLKNASCRDGLSSHTYTYEIQARRPEGTLLRGCCNRVGASSAVPGGFSEKSAR
jgi:uncharacterized membrane protein